MSDNKDGFVKSLFFGEIREDLLFPFPRLDPDVAEMVEMMNDSIGKFADSTIDSEKWDEEAAMPEEVITQVSEMGLMGLLVEEEHNGLGLPMMAYGRVFETLAKHDISLTVTVGAHQSIGYKSLLLYGSKEQKEKFLPRLATGELIAAVVLRDDTLHNIPVKLCADCSEQHLEHRYLFCPDLLPPGNSTEFRLLKATPTFVPACGKKSSPRARVGQPLSQSL